MELFKETANRVDCLGLVDIDYNADTGFTEFVMRLDGETHTLPFSIMEWTLGDDERSLVRMSPEEQTELADRFERISQIRAACA